MATRAVLTVPARTATQRTTLTAREHCDNRAKALMAERKDIESVVEEISSLAQPVRSRFMPTVQGRGRERKSRAHVLYDSHAIRSAEILTNGMTSGLSSPAQPWFSLKVPDRDLMRFHAVKRWLEEVGRVIADFLNSTNYYGSTKSGYGELGLFGTEACFMASHWDHGMVCYPLTFGEYWIGLSDALKPDTLLRQTPMTIRQIVERFVVDSWDSSVLHWDRVSNRMKTAWDNSRYTESFDVMHLAEPNPAWDPARFDAAGMRWRDVYWDPRDDDKDRLLKSGGQEEKPFWTARWSLAGSDPYGRGPGWNALADMRGLQAQARMKGRATDYAIRPAMMGSGATKLRMQPGSYTSVPRTDQDTVKPIWEVDYRAIGVLGEDVEKSHRKIDEHFYVDMFLTMLGREGVQPLNNEEVFARNEEKLTQLGPVIERVNEEKLGVSIDRAFGICLRKGMIPEPPPELSGMELQVDFISTLARAQRAVGLSVVERSLGFIGNMAQAFPEVTDNLDSDVIVTNYWERAGNPIEGLRDPKARDALRAARQQAAAAAQARESAPAIRDAAAGAELLSRTDIRGGETTALDTILNGGG